MKITLQYAEGQKDFYLPQFIPGSATFEASTLADELHAELVPKETIERAANFVARVYGNQFTAQEFVDGTHVWFLSLTIHSMETVEEAKKKLMEQLEMKPKETQSNIKTS